MLANDTAPIARCVQPSDLAASLCAAFGNQELDDDH